MSKFVIDIVQGEKGPEDRKFLVTCNGTPPTMVDVATLVLLFYNNEDNLYSRGRCGMGGEKWFSFLDKVILQNGITPELLEEFGLPNVFPIVNDRTNVKLKPIGVTKP